jgi:hypothetical protein
MLKDTCGPQRTWQETGQKLHTEEIHGLRSSLDTFWAIKLWRIQWMENKSFFGKRREMLSGFWWGNPQELPTWKILNRTAKLESVSPGSEHWQVVS